MSTTDVPARTLQPSSSMPSMDDLLCNYEAQSSWILVSMPNLTTLCHKHKCDRYSTYLEHLLIGAHVDKLCAYPTGLKEWQDHVWPATMNDICRDIGKPLAKKLDIACDLCDVKDNEISHDWQEINELHDKLAKEQCLRHRLEDRLARYKGKWEDRLGATMGSPLPHKWWWVPRCHPCCQQYTCQQIFLWR